MRKNLHPRGFTLIELLVVVAIISMLASIVLASLSSARAKARDAKRREDMRQLQTALELYYNDNGRYPPSCRGDNATYAGVSSSFGSCTTNGANAYIVGLVPNYIATLPIDPSGAGAVYGYVYANEGTGQSYSILDYASVDQTVAPTDPMFRCPSGASDANSPHTFAVYSGPAGCF